ncbi:MAG: isoleucine--tRNA ligase [SAR202 cluster bacterium]|nr:isoleucine--tRNA ligase [SAR202 cluster bacterium]
MKDRVEREAKVFKPVSSKVNFVELENNVLKWWANNEIPRKYRERNSNNSKNFSFIDGPITANNPMGVHHAWGRTYKDLFQRYKTMQGYKQRYQNGFDGQGLWIEVEVEKELGLNSKRDIEKFGVDKFVDLCKKRVRKFADIQTQQSIRLGYWMDWDNSYHTMSDENNYTIWHFLKVCHERGWIYEGTDVMPWCPRCGTGLSQHEIVTEGYKEIVHPGLYVMFPLIDRPDESLLVWTTTPWTLTGNTGVYIHPSLTYVKVRTKKHGILYLVKTRLNALEEEFTVVEEMPGKILSDLRYRGPFDELPIQVGIDHRVVLDENVSADEGTGIVHTAPGAGQIDFAISKREGLAVIAPLDEFGKFIEGFDWLTGKSVFEVNDLIYNNLREKNIFYKVERYSHRYPVCWRCETELVFRLVDEWFVSMDELRHMISDVTKKIKWVPEFGMQRELDWLHNMDDWMISKKRYWGLALPIYKCACGHFEVLGSEAELKNRAIEGLDEFEGHSPHRPWIDSVKIKCAECGAVVSRIKDVGNPWLDAGIVPFSTTSYMTDRTYWKEWFPADWVSESFPGQFRNWFYSLLTMSTALENTEPFRAIFSYALMRDDKGQEMHKSKGNAIWFEDAAEKMGVDSMRWLYSRQNPSANMNFGYSTADEARRRFLIPLWNVYSFFITYANIDEYSPGRKASPVENRPELDRWIISELNDLIAGVTNALENYVPDNAAHSIESFVEYLSNWYVRRSRRRFWKSDTDEDKLSAYATLYECLTTLIKLLAPFIPFVTEDMYQNLVRSTKSQPESVHLESWPKPDMRKIDTRLSEATRLSMRLSSLGRAARSKASIKVRQPLQQVKFKLRSKDESELLTSIEGQIKDELNVKEISILRDDIEVYEFNIHGNPALLGPKYGAQVREVNAELSKADPTEVYTAIESNQAMLIGSFEIEPDEITLTKTAQPGYAIAEEGGYIAAITTSISPELESEGSARDIVHIIQNMRKAADLNIDNHIETFYEGPAELLAIMKFHAEYIREETLSDRLLQEPLPVTTHAENHSINGLKGRFGIRKV